VLEILNKASPIDELTKQNPATGLVFLVDADIPYAKLLFEGLGRVEYFDRSDPLQRLDVLEIADVLAVRSSTRVGAELLAGCRNLKILATPVVGTDHIDFRAVSAASALAGHDIKVINAAGSTADAVADWTVGAMVKVLGRLPTSVGIVGAGNCGLAVAKRLDMLGVRYLFNDPPKAARSSAEATQAGTPVFTSTPMDEIACCEVITFHVPLTTPAQSAWPTADMISADFAVKARAFGCSLIVNCARGGIMDESLAALSPDTRPLLAVDVFKNEPSPSVDFVRACVLATPHIAGSGRIGRLNAATMIRRRVCEILEIGPAALPTAANHFPDRPEIKLDELDHDRFLNQIEQLSGVTLSDEFKHAWQTSNPHERPILFNTFRALGIRTEPLWIG
jgi:phosphoglycerate dehydrogenase-like enzyme